MLQRITRNSRLSSFLRFLALVGALVLAFFVIRWATGLVSQLAAWLDKINLKELVFYNGLLFLAVGLLTWLALRLRRDRDTRETWRRIFSQRRARWAFWTIIVYFILGGSNLVWLPYTQTTSAGKSYQRSDTALNLFFSRVLETKNEGNYSAPFADVVEYDDKKPATKSTHILGTDINGQDVLHLTIKGASTALLLSFGACLIVFPLAILLGIAAGYFGGWIDDFIIWLYTTVSSVPFLLLVIALIIIMGQSLGVIILAMGFTSWVGTCRLLRGETIKQKEREFVLSAKIQGAGHWRIIWKHIFPNTAHLVIIQFSLLASHFIFAETILSFLGIGLSVQNGSWGAMIIKAQDELIREPTIWWPFFAAGFVGIFPIVLSLNIFGDVVRDALDPKLRDEMR